MGRDESDKQVQGRKKYEPGGGSTEKGSGGRPFVGTGLTARTFAGPFQSSQVTHAGSAHIRKAALFTLKEYLVEGV
jgi:hypothetical protein